MFYLKIRYIFETLASDRLRKAYLPYKVFFNYLGSWPLGADSGGSNTGFVRRKKRSSCVYGAISFE